MWQFSPFFWEISPILFLNFEITRHIWAKKHFVENFHQPVGEKAFQKKFVKYTFLPKKKKKVLKIAIFLHIVQASSQDI